MEIFIIIPLVALVALILFAVVGMRSQTIFANPGALSDRQIEATIKLTQQIMARSSPGSQTWSRAASKHKAAIDEQMRRKGKQPYDNIELTPSSVDRRSGPRR